MQTLMNSGEPKRRFRLGKGAKEVIAAAGAVSVIVSGAMAMRYLGYKSELDFRVGIATYMALPGFSGHDFAEKAIESDARFKLYDADSNVIYFESARKPGNVLPSVSERPGRARVLDNKEKTGLFGPYNDHVFSFPVADLKLDMHKQIKINFGNIEYDPNLEELSRLIGNDSVCNGYNMVSTGEYVGVEPVKFVNHQFYTSKRGEPSLARFTARLLEGAGTNEEKAQVLLDFVTQKIAYDGIDTLRGIETAKRANEVLMTKTADCSGKSVLYASLLEQAGIDYNMMYFFPHNGDDGHLAVVVEGNFPDYNGLSFAINGKKYAIAETTIEGFEMGMTRVRGLEGYKNGKQYVQKACSEQGVLHRFFQLISSNSDIVDFDTGQPLKTAY